MFVSEKDSFTLGIFTLGIFIGVILILMIFEDRLLNKNLNFSSCEETLNNFQNKLNMTKTKFYFSSCCNSMAPTINTGDMVLYEDYKNQSLKENDIIAFVNPLNKTELVVHRIVSIKRYNYNNRIINYVVTKGDAILCNDDIVVRNDMIRRKILGVIYA